MSLSFIPSDLASQEAVVQILREFEATLPPLHAGIQPAFTEYAEQIQQIEALSGGWLLSYPEAGNVFAWAALVFQHQERLAEAEYLLKRAVAIWNYTSSAQETPLDEALFNLGLINKQQEKLADATALIQEAIILRSKQISPGKIDPLILLYLENLAEVYQRQGKVDEAGQIYQKALALYEQKQEKADRQVSVLRYKLAKLYLEQAHPQESQLAAAEQLLQQVREYYEYTAGPAHYSTARIVHKQAMVCMARQEWARAETLLQGVRATIEQQIQPPEQQTMLYHLAYTRAIQQKWDEETIDLLQSVSQAYAERLGTDNHFTLDINTNLALVFAIQEQWDRAEPLLAQTYALLQEKSDANPLVSGRVLLALAGLCTAQQRREQATHFYEQALKAFTTSAKPASLDILNCLQGMLALARQHNDQAGINRAQQRLQQHWQGFASCPAGPEAILGLNGLAGLCLAQSQFAEAEKLLLRALTICKDHQEIGPMGLALVLQNLALACQGQGKTERAKVFMQRAITIKGMLEA